MRRFIVHYAKILVCYLMVSVKPCKAQLPSAPQIDTSFTVTKSYFYNAPLSLPYSNGDVGIFNNAAVEIHSTMEVTLLPGFTASTDSGCGEFIAGLRECPVINVLAKTEHVSCYGKADGKIWLYGSGGNEPYWFNWTNSNKITQSISDLKPGDYGYLVTDQGACISSDSITILEPPPLTVQASTSPSECNESSGSVMVVASGGVGGYRFYWEKDGYNQAVRNELSAGLYEILVQDSNNCSAEVMASISDIDGPELLVEVLSEVSCHGYNDAAARIILPSSFGPEPVFPCGTPHDRLTAGHHPVLQQDSNGCISVVEIIITEPDPLTVIIEKSLPECGVANGIILATINGGTLPYTYFWDNVVGDSLKSYLFSGVYSLRVSDANGCSIEQSIFLPDSNGFSLSVTVKDSKCNKSDDGSIEVIPSGGTSPYFYRWFANDFEIGGNVMLLGPLAPGLYGIFAKDDSNCSSYDTIRIGYPDDFEVKPVFVNPSTDSTNDGSVTLYLSGATPPYTVDWSNAQSTTSIQNLGVGRYSYLITDQNDCALEGSVELADNSFLMLGSPCFIDPLQPFDYTGIMASCTSCNPQIRFVPTYNIETDFGADGSDNLSDQESFEWASDFIRQNYCSTGAKLVIPYGTYILGRQDGLPNTYLKGFSPLQFCDCENIVIEGLSDPITGQKPILKFDQCLKYGAFDPGTGLRYIRHRGVPLGNVHDYKFAAYPGYMIQLSNCKNFEITNLELDGNVYGFNIGGYFSIDFAGINLPYGGFRIDNCSALSIENCDAHHFGQDGILVRDLHPWPAEEFRVMNIRLLNSSFNHNCRDGFHWNGGTGLFASQCKFNYNGFGPWGGTKIRGGLEMEVDGRNFQDLANGKFYDCDFNFNNGAGIISNAQRTIYNDLYHNYLFKRCNIVSAAGSYSTFLENKDVTFECCNIAGQVQSAYDAYSSTSSTDNTKYLSCVFNEEFYDPVSGSIRSFSDNIGDCNIGEIGNASRMFRIEGGGKGRLLFDGCTFNASRYANFGYFYGRGLYGDQAKNLIIRNSRFYKRNGDGRNSTIETEPYTDYNRQLMWLLSAYAVENNKVFIPHSDNVTCYCIENAGHSVKPYCWYANACSIHLTLSTLKVPRAYWGGYCDFGAAGSGLHCLNFEPDGYTDATYTAPSSLPCVLKYENPSFTQSNINIWPPPWVPVPGAEIAPLYWLHPIQNPCLSSYRQHKPIQDYHMTKALSVYPVPAKDFIQVSNASIGENAYIYNAVGRIVKMDKILSSDYKIDIGHLGAGVYYLIPASAEHALKIVKID